MFKGKKMAGHLGAVRVTTQNLKVVSTDVERGLILIHGAVPGPASGWVLVRDAVKRKLPKDVPFPAGLRQSATPAAEAPQVEDSQVDEAQVDGTSGDAAENQE